MPRGHVRMFLNSLAPTDLQERVHCKEGSTSAQLVFETSTIFVRQSRSPEYRQIVRRFAPLWEVIAAKFKKCSLNRTCLDIKGLVMFMWVSAAYVTLEGGAHILMAVIVCVR